MYVCMHVGEGEKEGRGGSVKSYKLIYFWVLTFISKRFEIRVQTSFMFNNHYGIFRCIVILTEFSYGSFADEEFLGWSYVPSQTP